MRMRPNRRRDLLQEELAEELVLYDPVRHRAHCLDRTARLIWSACDGKTEVSELASIVRQDGQARLSEEAVWLALADLSRAGLLEKAVMLPVELRQLTRRQMVKVAGILASVVSLAAPTAAAAATCREIDEPCTASSQCCSRCCRPVGGGPLCKSGAGNCLPG